MKPLKSYLNPLELKENREKLASVLREQGFYIRLHGYDYLLMYNNKIICSIHLLPRLNECYVHVNPLINNDNEQLRKVITMLKNISPQTKIYVREFPKVLES